MSLIIHGHGHVFLKASRSRQRQSVNGLTRRETVVCYN